MASDFSTAEDCGYKLTDSYLSAEFSWVLLRSHDGDLRRVAVAYNFNTDVLELPGLDDCATVEYMDSFDDCLAALHSGEIDAYYTYTYQAERTIFDDKKNELRSMLSDERRSFCIGVNRDYDVLLRSVLNKSVNSLTRAEVVSITNKYINLGTQKFSLVRLAYQYPPVIVLTYLCVVAAIVCIRLVLRSRRFRAEAEKALHKAEEASAAKTEFLSNMSHDIRTPINGIMGMLDIAEENFDDKARVKDCIAKMRGAASHLLSLVNDVLDMSKIESGSMQMLNTPFDLRVLLDSCCGILEGQITERNMTFTKQIGPFWHPYLVGSELHIRQVLINILSNAVKYTPDGGEINFRAKETLFEEGLVHLRMEIKDNGIGMSEEFMQHIFEPFTQEVLDARSTYGGTGLGMPIAKSLTDKMGGTITFESRQGVGTTYYITLPLEIDPSAAPQPETEKPADDATLQGVNILLAEDNDLNLEIAQFLLENAGATVTAARNGQEAVDIFAASRPGEFDAILMDVMMPVMDGYTATRTIRRLDRPDAGRIPILAMTANAFAEDRRRAYEAGMNEHLTKPLETELVIKTLAKYRK